MKNKSTFGKDYFLEALPLDDADKKKAQKDVTVDKNTLELLKSLGMIKKEL